MSARTDPEIERMILADADSAVSGQAIAARYGISRNTVLAVLRRSGRPARPPSEARARYKFRSDYFASIETEHQAYWLGFISADGCVSRGTLHITISAVDRGHLEAFRTDLDWPAPLQEKGVGGYPGSRPCVSISIGRKKLISDLAALGVGPRKSMTLVPWEGPPDLMRHYWRGMFDGDGSLYRGRGGHGSRIWSMELVGSEPTARRFSQFAATVLGAERPVEEHGSIWRVRVGGVERPHLLAKLLYAGATVSLPRKQAIADEIINAILVRRRLTKPATSRHPAGPSNRPPPLGEA